MFADSRATLFDKHSRPLWMGILFSPLPSLFPLWPRVARQRAVVTMHEELVTGRGSCFETALSTSFPNLVPILKRIPRKYETAPLMPLATIHGSWHGNLIPKERRFKRTLCRNNYTWYELSKSLHGTEPINVSLEDKLRYRCINLRAQWRKYSPIC